MEQPPEETDKQEKYEWEEEDLIEQELERAVQEGMEKLQRNQPPMSGSISSSANISPYSSSPNSKRQMNFAYLPYPASAALHGLQCPRCLLYCVHPTDLDHNEAHINECLMSNRAPPGSGRVPGVRNMPRARLPKSQPRFGRLACEHVFCCAMHPLLAFLAIDCRRR